MHFVGKKLIFVGKKKCIMGLDAELYLVLSHWHSEGDSQTT